MQTAGFIFPRKSERYRWTQRATVPRCELYYLGQSKSNRTSWSWIEWFIQAVAADCRDNRLPPGKVPLQQTKLSGTHKPSDSWHSVWIKFWWFNYGLIINVYISDHQWEVWPLINSQFKSKLYINNNFFNNCPVIECHEFQWKNLEQFPPLVIKKKNIFV